MNSPATFPNGKKLKVFENEFETFVAIKFKTTQPVDHQRAVIEQHNGNDCNSIFDSEVLHCKFDSRKPPYVIHLYFQ